MIIYPDGYAIAQQSAGAPAFTNARIGYQTYLRALSAANITVSSESVGGPRDMPLVEDTYSYWQPTALPATWVADLGSAQSIDYVGIAAHTIGSSGCGVQVDTSPDNSVWTTLGSAVSPSDDTALFFLDTARTARYVRISLTGLSIMPVLGVIYAGVALAMQKQVSGPYTPISMARKSELINGMSRGGQFLGQGFRMLGVDGDCNFQNLDDSWVRAYFDAFSKVARQYPYFFAWNPQLFLKECAYVWTETDIVPKYNGQNLLMDVNWKMHGIGTA